MKPEARGPGVLPGPLAFLPEGEPGPGDIGGNISRLQ